MILELKNISKKFKNEQVIDNINYAFTSGKIYGIFGRNGSGKSVLLKIISNLYEATTGEILIDNVNYSNPKNFYQNFGVVIEKPAFIDDLTGKENLLLLSKIKNIINEKTINKFIKIVCLDGQENKKYKKYSMGMKQKLAIAQAIMENQKIILLDEPFNGIDRESVQAIKSYLKSISNDKIIIITTHIKEDIENFADVLLSIKNGKIENE